MSNGKPQSKKHPIDNQINQSRLIKKAFGQSRIIKSGVSSVGSTVGTSRPSVGTSISGASYLKTQGDSMIGPLAFKPYIVVPASNAITIDRDSNKYSSYIIIGSPATTINTIYGASFNGQILFLQGVQTITHILGTSGNIQTIDGTNYSLVNDDVVILIFDVVTNKWKQLTRGNATTGGVSLSGTNTWTGANVFTASSFSVTSANIILGDSSSDKIYLTGKIYSDIDMNTYDIKNLDRLKFSTTAGSGSSLTSTDTGIETLYTSGLPYGMTIQIPTANSAVLQIKRGSTNVIQISSLGTEIAGDVYLGTSSSDNVKIIGRIHSYTSAEIGIYVTNSTATVGTEGTLQIPYYTGTAPDSDATLNTKFGSINGAMGVWYDTNTTSNSRIYVRINSAWYHAFLTKSN